MKTGQNPLFFLIGLLIFYCLGIIFCAWQNISFSAYAPFLLALVFILTTVSAIFVLNQQQRTWIPFLGLFFILGVFRFAAAYELPENDIAHDVRSTVSVAGTVTEPPRISIDANGLQHVRYVLAVHTIVQGKEKRSGSGKLYIYTRGDGENPLETAQIGRRGEAAPSARLSKSRTD